MLCANSYSKEYVDAFRASLATQMSAYQALAAAAVKDPGFKAQLEAFEPYFFNALVLALDGHFVHRARAMETKDGNPLNEVRMLVGAIMNNGNVLMADKTIKYDSAKSVLKLRVGDRISLTKVDFGRLAAAFLAEIEAKYL